MKTRFKLSRNDTVEANLYTSNGKLLTTLYDSGYSNLAQIHSRLIQKYPNPPSNTKFSVFVRDSEKYWSNL